MQTRFSFHVLLPIIPLLYTYSRNKCKPAYLTKTAVRPSLKGCGDVNRFSAIHSALEHIGAINFGIGKFTFCVYAITAVTDLYSTLRIDVTSQQFAAGHDKSPI